MTTVFGAVLFGVPVDFNGAGLLVLMSEYGLYPSPDSLTWVVN